MIQQKSQTKKPDALILEIPSNPGEDATVITDFIRVYVQNSGCKNIVLGLSGGVDSATVAVLCQQTLGTAHTFCLFLPDETTPLQDRKHITLLLKKFKLKCHEKEITPLVHQMSSTCLLKPDKFALANIKARIRMALLFEYANMTKSLVCGTSNKSEILIGYFTKYGDGGVDIQPIGDLYKTRVYALAKHLKIPSEIIKKPPTAGLWKNQTDENEIGLDYQTLDKILYGLEQKRTVENIAAILSMKKSTVEHIHQMRKKSQHKRRTPLIPKLGMRTPGLDWRVPVQEG
ncbi:MAG: NAD+ synthase [Methanobacteriota archaeon]